MKILYDTKIQTKPWATCLDSRIISAIKLVNHMGTTPYYRSFWYCELVFFNVYCSSFIAKNVPCCR